MITFVCCVLCAALVVCLCTSLFRRCAQPSGGPTSDSGECKVSQDTQTNRPSISTILVLLAFAGHASHRLTEGWSSRGISEETTGMTIEDTVKYGAPNVARPFLKFMSNGDDAARIFGMGDDISRLTNGKYSSISQLREALNKLSPDARAACIAEMPLGVRVALKGFPRAHIWELLVRLRHNPEDSEALYLLNKLDPEGNALKTLKPAIDRARDSGSDEAFLRALSEDVDLQRAGFDKQFWPKWDWARRTPGFDEYGRMYVPGSERLIGGSGINLRLNRYTGPRDPVTQKPVIYRLKDDPEAFYLSPEFNKHLGTTARDAGLHFKSGPEPAAIFRNDGEIYRRVYPSPEALEAMKGEVTIRDVDASGIQRYGARVWGERLRDPEGALQKFKTYDLDELAPPSKPIEIQNGEIVVPPDKPPVPFGPTAVPAHLDPRILPGGTLSPIILPGGTLSDPTLTGALLMSGARRGVPGKLRNWWDANKPGWIFEDLGHGSLARRPYLGQLKDGRPVYMESELAAPKAGEVYWSEYGLYTYLRDKDGTLRRQALPKQTVYDGRQYTPAKSDITPEQGTLFFDFARGLRNGRGGSQIADVQTLVPAAIKPGETFQYNNGRIARCISISNGRPIMQLLPESEQVQPTWQVWYGYALRTDSAKASAGMTQAGLYDPAGGFTIYDPAFTNVGAKPVKPVVSGGGSSGSPAAAHQSQSSVLGGKSQVSTHSTNPLPVSAGAQSVTSPAAAPMRTSGSATSGPTSPLGRLPYELTQMVAYPTRITLGAPGNILRRMQGKPLDTPHIGGIPRLTNIMASASPTPLSITANTVAAAALGIPTIWEAGEAFVDAKEQWDKNNGWGALQEAGAGVGQVFDRPLQYIINGITGGGWNPWQELSWDKVTSQFVKKFQGGSGSAKDQDSGPDADMESSAPGAAGTTTSSADTAAASTPAVDPTAGNPNISAQTPSSWVVPGALLGGLVGGAFGGLTARGETEEERRRNRTKGFVLGGIGGTILGGLGGYAADQYQA